MDFYQAILAETGYKPKTTFWMDFTIADKFGRKAIEDTYKRAFNEWKNNAEYITELAMVLNWKSWSYAETNPAIGVIYQDLWEELDSWCFANLKDDALQYYIKTTD